MKRFVLTISCLLCAALLVFGLYYAGGFYIALDANAEPSVFARTQGDSLQLCSQEGWETMTLRGVNLSSGMPGEWSTDYGIDEQTYLRWFAQLQELGANVVRVYAVQNTDFYRALNAYNEQAETPLYLLQGIWVNDYVQNSHMDAYDASFRQTLLEDCKAAVDVLHGRRFLLSNDSNGSAGLFSTDVSRWTLGYVIGAEWTDVTVAYTNEKYPEAEGYRGRYLYTTDEATPFETLLAEAGDTLIAYETERYRQQRLVSFANTRLTDPFEYPADVTEFFRKCASIDLEHIRTEDSFRSGLFASYSCYTYDLDYLSLMEPAQWPSLTEKAVTFDDCNGTAGVTDTYLAYLKLLNAHHTIPVVILEFGAASGRGLAQYGADSDLREGHLSEAGQGEAICLCWQDITDAGCAGGCVYSWQDEWHKRTWNTMFSVDLSRNPYWSDAQSSDQHFGLLAFDPGAESICVVDGDVSEWSASDEVIRYDNGSAVSMKYDERYLYLRIEKPGYVFGSEALYLPLDLTPKTGSTVWPAYGLCFDRAADFVIRLHTADDSALWVQDRWHAIHANFEQETTGADAYLDPPAKDSATFEIVQMAVKDTAAQFWNTPATLDSFETGRLHCGNADPDAPDYDSLTDFAVCDGNIELRLPWALLNFSDPSRMQIHDDYYDGNYGVEFITVKQLAVGLGVPGETIVMGTARLRGWGNDVQWHERLKPAYYALQACWGGGAGV